MPDKIILPLHLVGHTPDTIPTITEILELGPAAEVREHVGVMGAMLVNGNPLEPPEFKWLGGVLMKIAAGADANEALRLKRNRVRYSQSEIKAENFLVNELKRQGVKASDARRIVASLKMVDGEPKFSKVDRGDALRMRRDRNRRKK